MMRSIQWKHGFLALVVSFTCSCFCGPRHPIYAPVLLESGVEVTDIVIPELGPEVVAGDRVLLHYELKLADGSLVDSSFERGQPIEVVVGEGELPAGLEEGLLGMRLFGKRRLVVPAALGYGEEGLEEQVPPNALLYFLLELMGLTPSP